MKHFIIPKLLSFVDTIQSTSKLVPLHAELKARATRVWYKTGFVLSIFWCDFFCLFGFFRRSDVKRISKDLLTQRGGKT